MQVAADDNDVVGYSDHEFIVTHSIRKTCTELMVDAGVPDASNLKRKLQKFVESAKAYQNFRGVTGLVQQTAIFPSQKLLN